MSQRNKKRIMLVDDENDVGVIFKRALERNHIIVDYFSDPFQALTNFKPGYYDLAILDIKMPDMSGTDLYTELKKKDSQIRICFISAYEMTIHEITEILPDYILNCLMKKPIPGEVLIARVLEALSASNV